MSERFEIAAIRHLRVGEKLLQSSEIDDAAYHFGVGGENALKYALRSCGLEQVWRQQGKHPNETPMRKHFPNLTQMIVSVREDIVLHATGILALRMQTEVLNGDFPDRIAGWSIDIRYADDAHTPVSGENCEKWKEDLNHFVEALIL